MPAVDESAQPPQSSVNNRTVAQHLVSALQRHGVEVVFGQSIPSSINLSALDEGMRQILVRVEKTGAMMADGYARVSGKVPVVTSLAGPGTPLMMAGMGEALHASIPMVALFQDVPRQHRDKNFAQEFDDLSALKAATKMVKVVERADRIGDYIDLAFVTAASGRPGPVALLLPPDLLEAAAEAAISRNATYGTFPLDRTVADPAQIARAAALIASAKRPLIVAGGGVHSSGAVDQLGWFQDTLGIPVATTMMGKGAVADTHPLTVGLAGYAMGRYAPAYYAKSLIDEADLIFLVGSRTNQNGTNGWSIFPRSAEFIHLDVDSREVGRNYEATRLVGDAKLTLAALRRELEGRKLGNLHDHRARAEQVIAAGRAKRRADIAPLIGSEATPIRPERVMAEIAKFLDGDSIVCADASYSTVWATVYIDALKPGMRFITPRGLAGIGWGFPIALGAKLARPNTRLVSISGDGGFAYGWGELETAARLGLPFVQVVLNNQVLGYQKDAEDASYRRHTPGLHFAPVDHAAIARACGWHAVRVEKASELAGALQKAFDRKTPALIDVVSDPAAWPPIQNFEGKITDTFLG